MEQCLKCLKCAKVPKFKKNGTRRKVHAKKMNGFIEFAGFVGLMSRAGSTENRVKGTAEKGAGRGRPRYLVKRGE